MSNSSGTATATEYVLIHIISLSFESEILHKFFPVSFHAATDEGTPQKISPQDTPTNGLTCQCNQTSLHHNLYRFAFLSEPCYVSVGNCKLLSGRGSFFRQWGQREVYNENEVFAADDVA